MLAPQGGRSPGRISWRHEAAAGTAFPLGLDARRGTLYGTANGPSRVARSGYGGLTGSPSRKAFASTPASPQNRASLCVPVLLGSWIRGNHLALDIADRLSAGRPAFKDRRFEWIIRSTPDQKPGTAPGRKRAHTSEPSHRLDTSSLAGGIEVWPCRGAVLGC